MKVTIKNILLLCMMQIGDIYPHPGPVEQNIFMGKQKRGGVNFHVYRVIVGSLQGVRQSAVICARVGLTLVVRVS